MKKINRGLEGRKDRFYKNDDELWIYDALQKCANKTITASMFNSSNETYISKYMRTPNLYVNEYFDKDHFKHYYKFTIVRDPLTRLISSFLFVFNNNFRYTVKDFENFIWELEAFENFKYVNRHWAPMNSILKWKDNSSYDFIGRFETLETDIRHIQKEIGVPEKIVTVNYHKTHSKEFLDDLKSSHNYKSIKRKIEDIYKEDYERFY